MTDQTKTAKNTRETAQWLGMLAWGLFGLMSVNVANLVRDRVGDLSPDGDGWAAIINQFGLGLVDAMPTIFLACALMDFARLFGRCGQGQVFTDRNVKTLRAGGDALILAAAASALFVPTLTAWISGNPGGFQMQVNDLALGVGAMGLALHGLAHIFGEAVLIKQENEEFV